MGIEHYIRLSVEARKSLILVTHADALSAALSKFDRGNTIATNMDYCARIVARCGGSYKHKRSVYAAKWKVEFNGIEVERARVRTSHEKSHLLDCQEIAKTLTERYAAQADREE